MSSSVDQRAAKGHENHAQTTQSKDLDYGYGNVQSAQQAAYSSSQMSAGAASNPYMANYYAAWNVPYPSAGGVLPESGPGVWSSRDNPMSYNSYGPLTTDYMQTNTMFGQYDYTSPVSWYGHGPGMDFATTWSPTMLPVHKSRDYMNGSYYNAGGGSSAVENAFNGEVDVNGMQTIDQGVKGMHLADEEESAHFSSAKASVSSGSVPVKKSWANIASQPARNQGSRPKSIPRAPLQISKQGAESGTIWDNKSSSAKQTQQGRGPGETRQAVSGTFGSSGGSKDTANLALSQQRGGENNSEHPSSKSASVDPLLNSSQYNPKEFDLNPKAARFFVIKSFSEDDIHRSIKYGIWCSTEYGNKRLDSAFHEREGKGPVYLYFSVNGSGHFCGMAQMTSSVDYHSSASVWAQDKWKGQFSVKWIYVKDVPNSQLRHIKLENNENKPVTNSRDTQEVPVEKGKQVLRIIHQYRHTTSIFDDFSHYEKQLEENRKQ